MTATILKILLLLAIFVSVLSATYPKQRAAIQEEQATNYDNTLVHDSMRAQAKYEAALKANSINYEAFIYPDVQHGFNNDTTPRYDEKAAKLAWHRTVEFFNKNLRN